MTIGTWQWLFSSKIKIGRHLVDIVLMAVTPLDLGAADAGDRPLLCVLAFAVRAAGDRPRLCVLAVEADLAVDGLA